MRRVQSVEALLCAIVSIRHMTAVAMATFLKRIAASMCSRNVANGDSAGFVARR
jgi:hypothetical protein